MIACGAIVTIENISFLFFQLLLKMPLDLIIIVSLTRNYANNKIME
jgi:hypothetical protein